MVCPSDAIADISLFGSVPQNPDRSGVSITQSLATQTKNVIYTTYSQLQHSKYLGIIVVCRWEMIGDNR